MASTQSSLRDYQQILPPPTPECKSSNIFLNDLGADEHKDSSSPFNFSDLGVMLDSLSSQQSQPSHAGGKKKKQGGKNKQGTRCSPSSTLQCSQILPEFHIWSEKEPKENSDRLKPSDTKHIKELLTKYDQRQSVLAEKAKMPTSSTPPRPPGRGEWDGEQYESTSAQLKPFRNFQKRMERSPGQCVRYGWVSTSYLDQRCNHSFQWSPI